MDILKTMCAEIAEAIDLMRPHFPQDSEDALFTRAETWRQDRYQKGKWTDFAEVAEQERIKAEQERIKAEQERTKSAA
jgi:hypothetical protein